MANISPLQNAIREAQRAFDSLQACGKIPRDRPFRYRVEASGDASFPAQVVVIDPDGLPVHGIDPVKFLSTIGDYVPDVGSGDAPAAAS